MKRNERLSVALHVLLHMAERPSAAMTSEEMAACVGTNSVVIRRTFAGLREAGIVSSVKGHGGGWRIARRACRQRWFIGRKPGLSRRDSSQWRVGRRCGGSDAGIGSRLSTITLAALAKDVRRLHGEAFPTSVRGNDA